MTTKSRNRITENGQAAPAKPALPPGEPLVVLSLTQAKANKLVQLCQFVCGTQNLDAAEIAVELAKDVREASKLAQTVAAQQAAVQQPTVD